MLCWAEGSRVGQASAGVDSGPGHSSHEGIGEAGPEGFWTQDRVQRSLPGAGEGRAKAGVWRGQPCSKHGFFPWAAHTTVACRRGFLVPCA